MGQPVVPDKPVRKFVGNTEYLGCLVNSQFGIIGHNSEVIAIGDLLQNEIKEGH